MPRIMIVGPYGGTMLSFARNCQAVSQSDYTIVAFPSAMLFHTITSTGCCHLALLIGVWWYFIAVLIWNSLMTYEEKAMAPYSSSLAWKIPWTEGPGRLQSMGSLRVGNDWATSLSLSCIGKGNGNPLQCSCLENPRDGGAWWAAIYGVAQSRTRLKQLSSSSSSSSNDIWC